MPEIYKLLLLADSYKDILSESQLCITVTAYYSPPDTSLIRTIALVLRVSVFERFHCKYYITFEYCSGIRLLQKLNSIVSLRLLCIAISD